MHQEIHNQQVAVTLANNQKNNEIFMTDFEYEISLLFCSKLMKTHTFCDYGTINKTLYINGFNPFKGCFIFFQIK